MKAREIRSEFLKYFKEQGHTVVESSPIVPQNDPTLLFTSAGMVQFKDCFLGTDIRPYKRAASAQKCLRAGGKHNDLERVGFTARHHTFFEMLGNFSFGDYFKKEAIHFAWEFVTKRLNLPKDRLYVTVFETDDEAAEIWHKQEGVPKERIYRFGEKDNFWAAGDTGPCGPCSEIFFDRGEKWGNGPDDVMGGDGDRFMEVWNLVFMQYERDSSGKLHPLARPSIDTGAGLERLASVLQDVGSNYDIDLFQNIIKTIKELTKVRETGNAKIDAANKASVQVIADHCRATNFMMADGILPSNEGRGYVLRRIMRRAIRHGRNLGLREPFFYKLTKTLIDEMGDTYPELNDKREFLEANIKMEEERFLATLENGLKVLEDAMGEAKNKIIPGNTAFKLYDTFGFPLDLTEVIATEKGYKVDIKGFEAAMEEQRSRSREHWKGSGEEAVGDLYKNLQKKGLKSQFVGYNTTNSSGKVLAVIEKGAEVQQSAGSELYIVVDKTPFYAESGGQVGDRGTVKSLSGFEAKVADVQKPVGDFIVVHCQEAKGSLKVGDAIEQVVDRRVRELTRKNHTATHMLHHALRKYLGNHVKQAGSLVTPDLLRFDFTHTKPMTDEEIRTVEDFINDAIVNADPVQVEETDKEKAMAKGAIAFFGDKYGASVRVVSVGDFSVELCGGTHVDNTASIQAFKILNENGIAAGVRRITAITGPKVVEMLRTRDDQMHDLMKAVNASAPEEVLTKVQKSLQAEKDLRKSLEAQTRKALSGVADEWIAKAKTVKSVKLVTGILPDDSGDASALLRDLAESIRSKTQNTVVVLGGFDTGKGQASLVVGVTKDSVGSIKAGDIVKNVAPIFDGRGGGKPDLAQAGGKDPKKFPDIFKAVEDLLSKS